jgi:hypothetical protein
MSHREHAMGMRGVGPLRETTVGGEAPDACYAGKARCPQRITPFVSGVNRAVAR